MKNQYILMHKTKQVMEITVDDITGSILSIGEIFCPKHLPVGVQEKRGTVDRSSLNGWWAGRSIPASRMKLAEVLEQLGETNTLVLAQKALGLSLSDHYWICPKGSNLDWDQVNFFKNSFSDDIGSILMGAKNSKKLVDFASPDNTSDGWLKKQWKIIDGKRCLLKNGSGVFQQEPYNEAIATAICRRLGYDHIPYQVCLQEGYPFSICENFASVNLEFIPAWHIFQHKKKENHVSNYQHYVQCATEMGALDVQESLDKMLILDFLIRNEDRHFGNFGILRNPETLEIQKVAPIFDSGSSLWFESPDSMVRSHPKDKAKPFKGTHEEQIKLVSSFGSLKFENLSDLTAEVEEILSSSPFLSKGRILLIVAHLGKRLELLRHISQAHDGFSDVGQDLSENNSYSGDT